MTAPEFFPEILDVVGHLHLAFFIVFDKDADITARVVQELQDGQ